MSPTLMCTRLRSSASISLWVPLPLPWMPMITYLRMTSPWHIGGQRRSRPYRERDTLVGMETPAPAESAPVWRFLITPRWVGWHALMVVAFCGMLWLGDWQFRRAIAGNGLSWAYTFEWPLFAGFAVVFWAKTIKDEFRIKRGLAPGPAGVGASQDDPPVRVKAVQASPASPEDDEDEELSAYNAYLARLNAEVKHHG